MNIWPQTHLTIRSMRVCTTFSPSSGNKNAGFKERILWCLLPPAPSDQTQGLGSAFQPHIPHKASFQVSTLHLRWSINLNSHQEFTEKGILSETVHEAWVRIQQWDKGTRDRSSIQLYLGTRLNHRKMQAKAAFTGAEQWAILENVSHLSPAFRRTAAVVKPAHKHNGLSGCT